MKLFGIPLNMDGKSRDNWNASMAQPVELSRVLSEVSEADAARLQEAHPSGEALVWGYHGDLGVQPGDVLVFAANKEVHHVGRVGVPFECEGLDGIWGSESGTPYRYAYTVDSLRDTSESLSFDEFDELRKQRSGIWRKPVKFGEFEDSVMADFLREEVLNLDRVPAINLSDLKNQLVTSGAGMDDEFVVEEGSIREQSTESATATVTSTERRMTFAEISLVDRFRQDCEARGGTVSNLRHKHVSSGRTHAETDAVVKLDGRHFLVEAKTTATANNVYTAIGQLAHYGSVFKEHSFTDRVFLASGEIKDDALRATLAEQGIDVVLENPRGVFTWSEAPEVYKDAWRDRLPLAAVDASVDAESSVGPMSVGQQASQEAMMGFSASSKTSSRSSDRVEPAWGSVPGVGRDASQVSAREME